MTQELKANSQEPRAGVQRLTLNQDDFARLVRGEVVHQNCPGTSPLQVALDGRVTYEQMLAALGDAVNPSNNGPRALLDACTFRDDDEEVRRWIYGLTHGEPTPPGSFLESFCKTLRAADDSNYGLLRPFILILKARYPKYRFTGEL